jgi:DNA adenine methylase
LFDIAENKPKIAATPPSISGIKVNRIRPPVKAHGGKYYLARQIVPILLDAPGKLTEYFEPCVFGGSMFLAMPKYEREIVADVNPDVVNLWRTLSNPLEAVQLKRQLSQIEYISENFNRAATAEPNSTIEQAAKFIVKSRFSRGGLGKSFAWSTRTRGGKPGDANSWDTFRSDTLPKIIERAANVKVLDEPCWWTIWESRNSPTRLIYVDPPYLQSTRTAKKAYGTFEMRELQHSWLCAALRVHAGPAAISGYRSDAYDRWLHDWRRFDFEVANNSGQGKTKQRRCESLWVNW